MSRKHIIHEVFPYLRVRDADAAIEFYREAFGAEEMFRLTAPDGRVGHAQLRFGDAVLMLSDEYPEYGIQGPQAFGGSGSSIHLHVDDVDAMTTQAAETGASVLMEPKDQFYGERSSRVLDPFGHEWILGSKTEEVSPEEMQRRFNVMYEEE
ncbi:VOC family protein [Candidatus Laterigemmans baculatus]|uniref:VOC family protein n=1 Tax=Candidatus Laterigemmans baculatus TaxID=2770505 RepID=UPI0013D9AF12|nr:VOC family protein [Candidatus Laterigemmans baculatus]